MVHSELLQQSRKEIVGLPPCHHPLKLSQHKSRRPLIRLHRSPGCFSHFFSLVFQEAYPHHHTQRYSFTPSDVLIPWLFFYRFQLLTHKAIAFNILFIIIVIAYCLFSVLFTQCLPLHLEISLLEAGLFLQCFLLYSEHLEEYLIYR